MTQVLVPLIVFSSITAVIIALTKFLTDYRLKKQLIEKGYVDKEAQFLFSKRESSGSRLASLKWGLILFFGGLSLVVMEYLPAEHDSPLPYGLFSLSVALGFLIYYFITRSAKTDGQS